MPLRALRFVTMLLAALGLAMGGAHVLELVPKMNYGDGLYFEVTRGLYRFYGAVGARSRCAR